MSSKRQLPTLTAVTVLAAAAGFAAPVRAQVYDKYFIDAEATSYAGRWQYNVWGPGPLGGSDLVTTFNGETSNHTGSTMDTTGRAKAVVAKSTTPYRDGRFDTATFSANLATASTSISGNNSGLIAGSTASGRMYDKLHFTVAGANASTRTQVQVEYTIAGSMTQGGTPGQINASLTANLCMNIADSFGCGAGGIPNGLSANAGVFWGNGTNSGGAKEVRTDQLKGVWGSWTSSTPELVKFVGTFELLGSSMDLSPMMDMRMSCAFSAQCNYTSTFRFVDLPSNVSFTSDSGVFLAAAVPEPQTYALFLAGLVAVTGLARRRQAAV